MDGRRTRQWTYESGYVFGSGTSFLSDAGCTNWNVLENPLVENSYRMVFFHFIRRSVPKKIGLYDDRRQFCHGFNHVHR